MMGRSATGIVCVAVSLFTPAPSLAVDQPREIRIGVASTGTGGRAATGGSFAAIAADRHAIEGEFASDGIKVRYTYFVGAGPSVNESLASGQIDFALQEGCARKSFLRSIALARFSSPSPPARLPKRWRT
jgi:ABC-type nitrate/sulfonate/bicarbonate transport system substrate-binding protein